MKIFTKLYRYLIRKFTNRFVKKTVWVYSADVCKVDKDGGPYEVDIDAFK